MSNVVHTNTSMDYQIFQDLIDEAAFWYGKQNAEARYGIEQTKWFMRDRFEASKGNYMNFALRDFMYYQPDLSEDTLYNWIYNPIFKITIEQIFLLHAYFIHRTESTQRNNP